MLILLDIVVISCHIPTITQPLSMEDNMGFKKMDKSLNFADFVLANSLKHNRSVAIMENIDKSINWSRIESILLSHYAIGTSSEGADAYPPLLLFKCLMLQKWFHINSDPELENQIHPVKYALIAFA